MKIKQNINASIKNKFYYKKSILLLLKIVLKYKLSHLHRYPCIFLLPTQLICQQNHILIHEKHI